FPALSDASIALFLNTASTLEKIPDHALRGNAMGVFQANVGLWQILARQGQIAVADQDDSWQKLIQPFARLSSSAQLFDARRKAVSEISFAATGDANTSQNELINLVAGPAQNIPINRQMHVQVADRIRGALNDQRLVSLDTLFTIGDGLNAVARG